MATVFNQYVCIAGKLDLAMSFSFALLYVSVPLARPETRQATSCALHPFETIHAQEEHHKAWLEKVFDWFGFLFQRLRQAGGPTDLPIKRFRGARHFLLVGTGHLNK